MTTALRPRRLVNRHSKTSGPFRGIRVEKSASPITLPISLPPSSTFPAHPPQKFICRSPYATPARGEWRLAEQPIQASENIPPAAQYSVQAGKTLLDVYY
ncbi:hypothetical protein E2C01_036717 [Portunus trituberculatus]|uniref:Uncharacterized protein n=1 Tax=Portunus trituberculatus TaxID=210409 RepID=A0A5B7F684_PORTR|nr:hypothetical protein [Portunus trituberculatus]